MATSAVRWEITDLLWSFDHDGTRRPVRRSDVTALLADNGQRHAAAVVRRLPARDGLLDPAAVDALGRRVHCELQRLGEELQLPRRIAHHLRPLVDALRAADPSRPVTVVDVGCGLGHVVRWLAAADPLGPGVEYVGADLNPVLVAEASRLAAREGLRCRFVCADAFDPRTGVTAAGDRTLVVSSGVLHHLPADDLANFFAGQQRLGVAAFAHWDIAPCLWSTLGAWVFHQARMREPVSRHDGVLSARRAHPASVLEAAARAGAPAYDVAVLEGPRWYPRALDVLRPVVGIPA